jgi:hypothetical protein
MMILIQWLILYGTIAVLVGAWLFAQLAMLWLGVRWLWDRMGRL